ncbi:MAG: hypothetical protein ABI862_14100 [Ilumatobacteraceae bacterium]
MIRLTDLVGQDAVSLATAEKAGTVKGVIVSGNRIIGVELSDLTIPASAVRSFEGDVLTYDTTAAVEPGTGRNPIGMRVLDVHGDEHGTIDDLHISANGTIETIILNDGQTINGGRLHAIGSYAAILAAELPPPSGRPVAQ